MKLTEVNKALIIKNNDDFQNSDLKITDCVDSFIYINANVNLVSLQKL